jgi:hypothetical protein
MSNILSQIGSAVKTKIDGVNTALTAEETARIAADSTLTTNLAAEASTARAAESANATAISDEATRATAAEGTLTSNLNTEISDRTTAVSNEASARASADTTLQGNIDAEATTARAAEAANANAISDEETARIAAVSSEASTRAAADTALQGEIDAEEVRAAAAEGVLTANLAQEVTDRQTAVTAEATTRAAAITNLDTVKANLSGATFTGAVNGTDLVLSGNLTVQGTTTSLETINSQVKDSIMLLNDGAADNANNGNDVGLIMERGSSEDNVALVFDEGEDKFVCYKTSASASATDISSADSDAELVDIKVKDVFIGSDNLGSLAEFTASLNA